MQHVKVDLPMAISMVLKQIETAGPDFTHRDDPNHPYPGRISCYNAFASYEYPKGQEVRVFKPGCLIGRVIVDSYEGDKEVIYNGLFDQGLLTSSFSETVVGLKTSEILEFDTTRAASEYLRVVQSFQDNGAKWGHAHAAALAEILHWDWGWGIMTSEEMEFFSPRGKILDLPEAVRLVLEVIEDRGEDFIHWNDPIRKEAENAVGSQCVNVFVKKNPLTGVNEYLAPGCLIGSAIHKAGWELETFGEYGALSAAATSLLVHVKSSGLYSEMTPIVYEYMRVVQRLQDDGFEWGKAHVGGLGQALWSDGDLLTRAEKKWLDVRQEWQLNHKGETTGSSI